MKAQHQIKFNRKRPQLGTPAPRVDNTTPTRLDAAAASADPSATSATDVVRASVTIGDRELKFARALSDSSKAVRERSLSSLRQWLEANAATLGEPELQRLCKALFYCIWMADRRPVISRVVADIVALADVSDGMGLRFVAALFNTLVREWFGIDRHRIDKYYELVNAALAKAITLSVPAAVPKPSSSSMEIDQENKDTSVSYAEIKDGVAQLLNVLCTTVWYPARKQGIGLALHILDVYLDRIIVPVLSLAVGHASCGAPKVAALYTELMADIYTMMAVRQGWVASLSTRIQQRILARLIEAISADDLALTKVMQRIIVDKTSKALFKVAADKATEPNVRPLLYDLHLDMKVFVQELKEDTEQATEEEGEDNEEEDGKNDKENEIKDKPVSKVDGKGKNAKPKPKHKAGKGKPANAAEKVKGKESTETKVSKGDETVNPDRKDVQAARAEDVKQPAGKPAKAKQVKSVRFDLPDADSKKRKGKRKRTKPVRNDRDAVIEADDVVKPKRSKLRKAGIIPN